MVRTECSKDILENPHPLSTDDIQQQSAVLTHPLVALSLSPWSAEGDTSCSVVSTVTVLLWPPLMKMTKSSHLWISPNYSYQGQRLGTGMQTPAKCP